MPAATRIFIQTQPVGNNFSGRPLTIQPQCLATDASIAQDTGYNTNATVTLNVLTGSPVLSGTTTKAFVAGSVSFTDLVVTGGGTYTLTFSSGALTAQTTGTLRTYAASQLVVVTQPGTIPAGAGAYFPYVPIRVEARTPGNALDPTVGVASGATANEGDPRVTIVITTPAGAVLTGRTAQPFYAGVATGRGLAVSLAGTYTYTVSYNGVSVTSGSFVVGAAVDRFYNPGNTLPGLGVALPRSVPDASVPVQPGATFTVGAGGNYATPTLAEAAWFAGTINYGDTIVLLDGNTFTENVRWRKRTWTSGVLVIKSQTEPTAAGRRTKPGDWTTQAIWQPAAGTQPALSHSYQTSHVRLQCVQLRSNPTQATVSSLVELGFNDDETALVTASGTVPDNLIMDRCYLHHDDPTSAHTCNRAVRWRSSNSAIVNCHMVGFQNTSNPDAQAVLVDNTPGPLLFDNNYTEGESENFMVGGNDFLREDLVPRDVTVRRSLFRKPLAQVGIWNAKNLFELKAGHRVEVTACEFDGTWDAGITQWSAVNIKSVNQSSVGAQGYTGTSDIAVHDNGVRSVPEWMSCNGGPQGEVEPLSRVIDYNNAIVNAASVAWYNGANNPQGNLARMAFNADVAHRHCAYVSAPKASLQGPGLVLAQYDNSCERSVIKDCLMVTDGSRANFINGNGVSSNMNAVIAGLDPLATFAKNYLTGLAAGNAASQNANAPVGNTHVDQDGGGNVIDPGFTGGLSWRTTAATDDFLTILDALKPTLASPLHAAGTDGLDIGLADVAGLKLALTGVWLGVYGAVILPVTPSTPAALSLTLPVPSAKYSQQDQQQTRRQIEQAFAKLAARQAAPPVTGAKAGNVALTNLLTAIGAFVKDATS